MQTAPRLVGILRDFLEVHRLVRELARQHREEGLHFAELTVLIGDDESSVLFRLKERTHAVFREPAEVGQRPTHREALFDLAVGSLFHEAMKLRESLYQREVYGPRVRALRSEAGGESKALFDEFERMLAAVGDRLDEGVRELEDLERRTAEQLRLLLAEPAEDATARFLTEHSVQAEEVFGVATPLLLEQMFGSVAEGYARAGRSYLASGYFARAAERFERARAESDSDPTLTLLADYAHGMQAYLSRDYRSGLRHLGAWAGAGPPDPTLLALARDAVASVLELATSDEAIAREAAELLESLGGPTPRRRPEAPDPL